MNRCAQCWAWNAPLHLAQQVTAEGVIVALRFEQWLLYHLHVAIHQAGAWPGELPPPGTSVPLLLTPT